MNLFNDQLRPNINVGLLLRQDKFTHHWWFYFKKHFLSSSLGSLLLQLLLKMEAVENQTYSYYFMVKELPQFIVFSVWLLVVAIFLNILSFASLFSDCLECFLDYFRNPIIEFVFGAMLKRDDEEFTLFNEKVPVIYAHQLYTMAISMIGVALMQFWDDLSIEESHTCSTNPQIACFPVFPDMDTPRLNCSNTEITSVICYRLVLRIGSAAASALGVVTVSGLTMYFLNFFLVKIPKLKEDYTKALTAMVFHLFFGIIILAGTVFVSYLQFNSSSTRADQATEILKNINVGTTLLYCISYNPWTGLFFKFFTKHGDVFVV